MIRTQISLFPDEYALAKKEARRRGLSIAALLREGLRSVLPRPTGKRPWMRYSGDIVSGDPRSSERIDEVVYGEKP